MLSLQLLLLSGAAAVLRCDEAEVWAAEPGCCCCCYCCCAVWMGVGPRAGVGEGRREGGGRVHAAGRHGCWLQLPLIQAGPLYVLQGRKAGGV